MANEIDDGGTAFPFDDYSADDGHCVQFPGLSIRDWFAGMALQGILANKWADTTLGDKDLASGAYILADAMLVKRKEAK